MPPDDAERPPRRRAPGARKAGSLAAKYAEQERKARIAGGRQVLAGVGLLSLLAAAFFYYHFRDFMDQVATLNAQLYHFDERVVWVSDHWGLVTLVEYAVPGVLYIALFLWARTHPVPALKAGLAVCVVFLLVGLAIERQLYLNALRGTYAIAVVCAMVFGIQSALKEERLERDQAPRTPDEEDAPDASA